MPPSEYRRPKKIICCFFPLISFSAFPFLFLLPSSSPPGILRIDISIWKCVREARWKYGRYWWQNFVGVPTSMRRFSITAHRQGVSDRLIGGVAASARSNNAVSL